MDAARARAGVLALCLAAMAAGLLLAGCARSSGAASSGAGSDRAAARQDGAPDDSQAETSADPLAGMVSAVNPRGSASKALAVKFRIETRPVVGTPVRITLALIPDADTQIDRIHGSFLAGDGLALQSDRSFDLSKVQGPMPVFREVTVVPQQTGALSLNVTLLLQIDKSSETRSYAIPLIASDNSSN